MTLAVAGVWFFAIRDTGPTQAEIEADRKAKEEVVQAQALAEAQAEQATCQQQLGGLLDAERQLDSLLNGVGLDFQEYSDKIGDVSVSYGSIRFKDLALPCLTNVGEDAEKAMNSWVHAGQIWNNCYSDIYCDDDSIDSERQLAWLNASTSLQQASKGMEELGQP